MGKRGGDDERMSVFSLGGGGDGNCARGELKEKERV